MNGMHLNDTHDADEILREPFDEAFEEEKDNEEEMPELNLGDSNKINDLDIPDEEDDYGL